MEAASGQSSGEVDRVHSFLRASSDGAVAVEKSRCGTLLSFLYRVVGISSLVLAGAISVGDGIVQQSSRPAQTTKAIGYCCQPHVYHRPVSIRLEMMLTE